MLSTDFVLAMLTALHRHNLMQRIGIVTSCRLAACFITFYALNSGKWTRSVETDNATSMRARARKTTCIKDFDCTICRRHLAQRKGFAPAMIKPAMAKPEGKGIEIP